MEASGEWTKRLRRAVRGSGIPLTKISARTGISRDTLNNWFGREDAAGQPSVDDLLAICRVIKVDIVTVLTRRDERLERIIRRAVADVREELARRANQSEEGDPLHGLPEMLADADQPDAADSDASTRRRRRRKAE